jgi:histidyl-tRNA synthetase
VVQLALDDAELARDLPQSVDFLSEESRLYFKRLLEFLDEGKVPYVIDTALLTTDDYKANTLWEFVLDPLTSVAPIIAEDGTESGGLPAQASIVVLHGGRYDRLAELLGGPALTPASGWILDADLVVARLAARDANVPDEQHRAKVFLSQLGDAAKKKSLMLFEDIRRAGIDVRYSLSRDTIKGQLKMASRYGAKLALIFVQKEALEGTVMVREMETGIQETIPQEKIIEELKKRLRSK